MSKMLRNSALFCASAIALSSQAFAADVAYVDGAAFDAATAGASFSFESFEGTPDAQTATSLTFGDVTFACTGTQFCPSFFGASDFNVTDGVQSVFFATPDIATLTFAAPITAFAIDVIGLGDVGETSFFVDIGSGPLALQSNYSVSGQQITFAGVTGMSPFTTVSFSGTQGSDGIFFDNLKYTSSTLGGAVPEPATWAMMLLGFFAIGGAMRVRRNRQTVSVSYA